MIAPGHTDPGAVVDRPDIAAALEVLTAIHSPHGEELAGATVLCDWVRRRWPHLDARLDVDGATANLVLTVGGGPELVVYSHLDTSLTGSGIRDGAITGHDRDAPRGLRVTGDRFAAFGVGVARGPAAAALVGFAAAAEAVTDGAETRGALTLLLAGGGTHRDRTGPHGAGVRRFLDSRPRPAAAVVAKGGPEGLLHDEPGAVYLTVRIGAGRGAVLARDRITPPGGLAAHAGVVVAAIERWRTEAVRGPGHTVGQTAREAGIGSLVCGSPEKPDLLPAVLTAHVYLVTVPGDEVGELVDALREILGEDLRVGPLSGATVDVTAGPHQRGGRTAADAPIVAAATRAWTRWHGGRTPPVIAGWTGSTDGTVFREYGVETVRTGPLATADPADPDLDVIEGAELVRFAEIYAQVGTQWLFRQDWEG